MSGQENPYEGEDPQAIAKQLQISLKALEGLRSVPIFNTREIDIPRGLRQRYGMDALLTEGIAQALHEDFVRQAVTERLQQEIGYINEQPETPEPSQFALGVGGPRATDGPPNASPMTVSLAQALADPAHAEPGMTSLAATMFGAAASITPSNPLGWTLSLAGGSTMSGTFAANPANALSVGFATGAFGAATGNSVPTAFNPTNFARSGGGDDAGVTGATPGVGTTGATGDAPGGQAP
jgi:hypothetical protein